MTDRVGVSLDREAFESCEWPHISPGRCPGCNALIGDYTLLEDGKLGFVLMTPEGLTEYGEAAVGGVKIRFDGRVGEHE
jgi:hypothetical protein